MEFCFDPPVGILVGSQTATDIGGRRLNIYIYISCSVLRDSGARRDNMRVQKTLLFCMRYISRIWRRSFIGQNVQSFA